MARIGLPYKDIHLVLPSTALPCFHISLKLFLCQSIALALSRSPVEPGQIVVPPSPADGRHPCDRRNRLDKVNGGSGAHFHNHLWGLGQDKPTYQVVSEDCCKSFYDMIVY